jgi:hypothetical protein
VQQKFDVYFTGEILEGRDTQQVREAVGKLFKLSGDRLDALFSGEAKRIKKNLSVDQSGRFREVFREAGAIVDIVIAGQKPPLAPPPTPVATIQDSGLKLAPVGSILNSVPGSAESTTPPALSDTNSLEIAPIGPIPAEPSPPAANIDTGDLQAEPAASGSLEDYAPDMEPAPLPDISSLEIVQDNQPIQEDESEAAESIPDTSHLEAAPAKTGTLEKFTQDKKPVPVPDISNLSLDS